MDYIYVLDRLFTISNAVHTKHSIVKFKIENLLNNIRYFGTYICILIFQHSTLGGVHAMLLK